jgi:hypothetical protein
MEREDEFACILVDSLIGSGDRAQRVWRSKWPYSGSWRRTRDENRQVDTLRAVNGLEMCMGQCSMKQKRREGRNGVGGAQLSTRVLCSMWD